MKDAKLINISRLSLLVFWVVFTLTGCIIDKNDPMSWHPLSIAASLTAETIGFTYRTLADGEIEDLKINGTRISSSESFPCFTDPGSVNLSYAYRIISKKGFKEKVIWRRGDYLLTTNKDIHYGKSTSPFPIDRIRKDLGDNWPGFCTVDILVKGEPRGSFKFRLASRKIRDQLLNQAEELKSLGGHDLCQRLKARADLCWPESME